uniref:Uncharacterized protein n=1 Tax=Cacopsylla melanoneura TaxID=428564 RepID=A0A8D8RDB1_9HEMI
MNPGRKFDKRILHGRSSRKKQTNKAITINTNTLSMLPRSNSSRVVKKTTLLIKKLINERKNPIKIDNTLTSKNNQAKRRRDDKNKTIKEQEPQSNANHKGGEREKTR